MTEQKNEKTEIRLSLDETIMESFRRAASENNTTAEEVLEAFIKDYVVSSGHPETVVSGWPWSKGER